MVGVGGRSYREGIYIYIYTHTHIYIDTHIPDSLPYTAETNAAS